MVKTLQIKVKCYVGEKLVSKPITDKNLTKYFTEISGVMAIRDMAIAYTDREKLLATLVEKNSKGWEGTDKELRSAIRNSFEYKDNLIYFENLKVAADKVISKLGNIPVMKSRIVYSGKGSNYMTIGQRKDMVCGRV